MHLIREPEMRFEDSFSGITTVLEGAELCNLLERFFRRFRSCAKGIKDDATFFTAFVDAVVGAYGGLYGAEAVPMVEDAVQWSSLLASDANARKLEVLYRGLLWLMAETKYPKEEWQSIFGSPKSGGEVIKQAVQIWRSNEANGDEAFWQRFFGKHSFVLSQVFSFPVVVLREKAFVGGKSIGGSGGKNLDFILRNVVSTYALIVEIKTPVTPLLSATPYRPPDIYSVNSEVTGGVVQVSKYKDEFLKNFYALSGRSEEKFGAADPPCLLVVGHSSQLDSEGRRCSFELFRQSQKCVQIVTFDELRVKAEMLLGLL